MKILATIHNIATDREAESTIQFKVPSSELAEVQELFGYFEKLLSLDINVHEDNPRPDGDGG